MGVASLVLGIISIVFCFPPASIIGIITGIIAIVLGVMAKKNEEEKGKATAGFVMGIIGLSLSALLWISCAYACNRVAYEMEKHGITSIEQGFKELEKVAKDPKTHKALDQIRKMGESLTNE
ncbi:MAG TPA: DUF4190 domain-containing protein [Spirochaetota bacterium]|nr:DUF4190 domain-containing protein [Spirochaetota bacterium]